MLLQLFENMINTDNLKVQTFITDETPLKGNTLLSTIVF
jgi:hypothetical protein